MEDQLPTQSGFRLTSRLVLGLFIVLIGGLLLLDHFGQVNFWDYFRFWPVALILLGISKVLHRQSIGFGLVLTGVGTWLLLDNLDWVELDGDLVIPILLLLLGISMIWKELTRDRSLLRGANPGDVADSFVIMGGISQTFTTQAFQGGSATAVMGGVEIDLRQAAMAGDRVVLDTFTWWGGVDIYVPEDWEVIVRGIPILGGFDDKTQRIYSGRPQQLIITGYAIMGGVDIKNSPKGK